MIIFTNKQRVYLYQYVWHEFFFTIFSFFVHVILIKTTIYFRVVTKDLDFSVWGGYIVRYGKPVSSNKASNIITWEAKVLFLNSWYKNVAYLLEN